MTLINKQKKIKNDCLQMSFFLPFSLQQPNLIRDLFKTHNFLFFIIKAKDESKTLLMQQISTLKRNQPLHQTHSKVPHNSRKKNSFCIHNHYYKFSFFFFFLFSQTDVSNFDAFMKYLARFVRYISRIDSNSIDLW